MTILHENLARPGHYIVSEANGYRSREQVVIASGAGKLEPGAVLAKAASGEFVPLAPAATDGTQNAAAILFEGCDATAAAARRTITARDSEVQAPALIWPAAITASQKAAALAALAALGIVAR